MYIITLLLRCRIHYFTQFEASKTKIAALQVQQPRKKNQAIGKQFFEGYGSYKRYIYCSDAVRISMSSDTNAIQDLLKIRIKSRDDGLTDQYNRIIMVKLLAILSLIMTAAWFEESISCMVPGTIFLRVLKFSVLKKPSKHKFTSRYTLENDM